MNEFRNRNRVDFSH